jgi:peroxiredoxin
MMKQETKKKLISWLNQGLIFIGIFFLITWWQQKDMLMTSSDHVAPSFSLVSMKDEVFQFEPLQQTQKTLIYFFAPWCSVCHASIDNIEAIKKSSQKKINFIIIALDWKSKQEVELFIAKHELTVPVLLGTREVSQQFKIAGFPSYYVVDRAGKLQSKDMGYTTELGMRLRLGLSN